MNKTDLIKKIAEKTELSQTDSKKALEAAIAAIKEALSDNEPVTIVGFGTFSATDRPAHIGKNPRTGEAVEVPAKKVAKFKPSVGIV